MLCQYVEEEDKYRTFNMGVGMVLIVENSEVDSVIKESGGYVLGELINGEKAVKFL